jgi:hypothetical protein
VALRDRHRIWQEFRAVRKKDSLDRSAWFAAVVAGSVQAHTLRHSCLTNLVRRGHDRCLVAEIAAHKRIETTRRYSQCVYVSGRGDRRTSMIGQSILQTKRTAITIQISAPTTAEVSRNGHEPVIEHRITATIDTRKNARAIQRQGMGFFEQHLRHFFRARILRGKGAYRGPCDSIPLTNKNASRRNDSLNGILNS